jgi:hypothetical protein
MSEIVKNLPGGLPADFAEQLMGGIALSPINNLSSGGKPFVKMDKGGNWSFGPNSEPIQEGSLWIINPMSFIHGWVCWIQGDKNSKTSRAGEIMCSMAKPMPPQPEPSDGHPFTQQFGFDLKCRNGADEGVEAIYKTNSHGGTQAVSAIVDIFRRHFATPEGKAFPCPVISFGSDSYRHENYGTIYKPELEITDWADMNGRLASDGPHPAAAAVAEPAAPAPAPAVQASPAPQPAAARSKKPPLSVVQPPVAPPSGQRRRPVVS